MSLAPLLEQYAPEITPIVAELEDEVRYNHDEWFLHLGGMSLHDTRNAGDLTPEAARAIVPHLRRRADEVLPLRQTPRIERAEAIVTQLRNIKYKRGHILDLTTPAWDRAMLAEAFGHWDASITIGRETVGATGRTQAACVDQLAIEVRRQWSEV